MTSGGFFTLFLVLVALPSLCCAGQLAANSSQYFFYAQAPVAFPDTTLVINGIGQAIEALPMWAVAEHVDPLNRTIDGQAWHPPKQHDEFVVQSAEAGDKYMLVDTSSWIRYELSFELFDTASSPLFTLKSDDLLAVEGVLSNTVDDGNSVFIVYAIAIIDRPEAIPGDNANYVQKGSTATLKVLFVLMNFADATSTCTKASLDTLDFSGTQNIVDCYNTVSKGRQLVEKTADYATHAIAGPYSFPQFSTTQSCDTYYSQWQSAAAAAAKADGFDMTQFGTIAMVTPRPPSCAWAGLASRSTFCVPGSSTQPFCFAALTMCLAMVHTHELGHNMNFAHSAIDPLDGTTYVSTDEYKDWSCTMGNHNTFNSFNVIKQYIGGWLDTSRVVEGTPGAFTLTALDNIADTTASSPKALVVDADGTKSYYISLRKQTGYAAAMQSQYVGINLHYALTTSSISRYIQNVAVGGSYLLKGINWRLVVSSVATGSDTAQVTIFPCDTTTSCSSLYQWVVGTPGSCSSSCGGGTATVSVTCQSIATSTAMADGYCVGQTKPSTSQACNTNPCVGNVWVTGAFSQCTLPCNGGVQTRVVQCIDQASSAVQPDSACSGTKPVTQQSCNTAACTWSSGSFSSCSLPCATASGPGTQTRTVACNAGTTVVADTYCPAGSKPVTSQSCNTARCTWTNSSWTVCDQPCFGGSQSRTVTCNVGTTSTTVAASYCSATTQPPSQQSCNVASCTWLPSAYSTCSASCGGGTQTRSIQCLSAVSAVVSNSYCGSSVPATQQNCNTQSCTNSWGTPSAWSTCSLTCGGGTQTRTVSCIDSTTSAVVADSLCSAASKPITSQACNTATCPVWTAGNYGTCSVTCAGGTQTRTVTCSYQGATAADSLCSAASKPASSQACNTAACPTAPQWSTGSFGTCSATCGSGTQTRTVTCLDVNSNPVADSFCTAGTKPASSQACNTDACPTATWSTGNFGTCSATCGSGTQTRTVTCTSAGATVADSLCPAGSKPASSQACNTDTCPSWNAGTFGTCSVSCGGGTQSRSPTCTYQGATVADSMCQASAKPTTSQACNTQSCDPCVGFNCGEFGTCSSTGGTASCTCRDGYAGTMCDVAPTITGVTFTRSGSTLNVAWQSTGNVLQVSVVFLLGSSTLPVTGSSNVANAHAGSFSASLLYPRGTGAWTAKVIFNDVVQSSSPSLNIDICSAFNPCGAHGNCTASTGLCACQPNYSGTLCSVFTNPCASLTCLNGGKCVTSSTGAAKCDCSTAIDSTTSKPYTGDHCDIKPGCSMVCNNGGTVNSACSSCSCAGNWGGASCSTCNLACTYGSPDSTCTTCVCQDGFAGSACNLHGRNLRLGLFVGLKRADIQANVASFYTLFAADVAMALAVTSDRVVPYDMNFDSLDRISVYFTLRSLPETSYALAPSLSSLLRRQLAATDPMPKASSDLAALLTKMQNLLLDRTSLIYKGTVTSYLAYNAAFADNAPVANSAGSGGSDNVGLYAGAAVGAAVAIAIIIAAVVLIRRRRNSSSRKMQHQSSSFASSQSVAPVQPSGGSISPRVESNPMFGMQGASKRAAPPVPQSATESVSSSQSAAPHAAGSSGLLAVMSGYHKRGASLYGRPQPTVPEHGETATDRSAAQGEGEGDSSSNSYEPPVFGQSVVISSGELPIKRQNTTPRLDVPQLDAPMAGESSEVELPVGWYMYTSDDGIPYYANPDTGESSWEVPTGDGNTTGSTQ